MEIGIIGTPNRDTLIFPDRRKNSSWGGIVYSILTLAHYLQDKGEVLPICAVGEESCEEFRQLFTRFPNVRLDALQIFPGRQNRVTLKIITQDDKEETAELAMPPLPFEVVQPHLTRLDYLLVNFTSGRDVTKETFRRIRDEFKRTMLVDVHSLTLSDPDSKGRRRLRNLADWQEWLEGVDYVQLAWNETVSLTGRNQAGFSGIVEVADWLLEHGTRGVIVTRGAAGTYYFHSDEQGILKKEIPPFPLQTVVDTTGCGDVFSASFIYNLALGVNPLLAAEHANRSAALKATFSGIGPWVGK